MLVTFQRTGRRQYRVEVRRPPFAAVEMDPAPGYDDLIPHDMMHLVVESQLGLERGIFGQLAAGGGTFRAVPDASKSTRDVARQRRRLSERGKKMMRDSRAECEQSEAAVWICWNEWRARSESKPTSIESKPTSIESKLTSIESKPKPKRPGSPAFSEHKLEQIFHHLDELSLYWSRLNVGESMTVQWPDLSVSSDDNQ